MNTAGHREKSAEQILTIKNEAWSSVGKAQGLPSCRCWSLSVAHHPQTGKGNTNLSVSKTSQRTDRLLVLYLSYFQTTVTKGFNFYNTLYKKIKFK